MQALQTCEPLSSDTSAMARLYDFLRQRQAAQEPVADLETFEQQLHALFVAAEREAMGEELARFDVDVPTIEVKGQRYYRVLRCAQTYSSAAGPVRVERTLYRARLGDERALCPLELRAGLIEGYWTPLAAKQATWSVAHLTPQESEACFAMLGNMAPSKSSLDRLPKQLSARWERQRWQFEAVLRQQETVPEKAVSMAVSLDGVMVPMKDGRRREKRLRTAARGQQTRGPAGHQEVGCGTLSFYDAHGVRLGTRRLARMPESHKGALKASLTAEVFSALVERPDLRVMKLADGAPDNWTYLDGTLPVGEALVDFFMPRNTCMGHWQRSMARRRRAKRSLRNSACCYAMTQKGSRRSFVHCATCTISTRAAKPSAWPWRISVCTATAWDTPRLKLRGYLLALV